jgi:hypothetical protein
MAQILTKERLKFERDRMKTHCSAPTETSIVLVAPPNNVISVSQATQIVRKQEI